MYVIIIAIERREKASYILRPSKILAEKLLMKCVSALPDVKGLQVFVRA
jgi:hypothetical protein